MKKHFTSSILLWVRTDQPRQTGMDYWKGPHSGIISATPGLEEYRQIHLAEDNPGLWPAAEGSRRRSPSTGRSTGSRKSPSSRPCRRCRAARRRSSRSRTRSTSSGAPCYTPARRTRPAGTTSQPRLRRSAPAPSSTFAAETASAAATSARSSRRSSFPALVGTGVLKELRTQTFLPWNEKLWDTPNVAHDNPPDQRFHASLILGFTDPAARAAFFDGSEIEQLSQTLAPVASAIHAYDVSAALTYVKNGEILPHYEQ